MAHEISGILVEGAFDAEVAAFYDLQPLLASSSLTFFPLDHYFLAYWAHKLGQVQAWGELLELPPTFPLHSVLQTLIDAIALEVPSRFAVVMTSYFGGIGGQWVVIVDEGRLRVLQSINDALSSFGIQSRGDLDEFASYGFSDMRRNPDFLLKYGRWCGIYNV